MRGILRDGHATDRGVAVVLAFVHQMNDKGVHLGCIIINQKLLVLTGIFRIFEGFSIVVDRDFNTGCVSRKISSIYSAESQAITDRRIQLRGNAVVIADFRTVILGNLDLVNKNIRIPEIGHFGINAPLCKILVFSVGILNQLV